MSENKSWCPIPWNSISTRLNGYYRLCSQSHADKKTMGIFRDDAGKILTADNTSIEEARNSNLVKEVREYMIRGELHPTCYRCNHEDSLGIMSRRQWSKTETDQIDLGYCIENTKDTGEIDTNKFAIREADLRFGNFCNIKCRSCWPGESTAWYEDWYKLGIKKFNVNPDTVHLTMENGKMIATGDDGFKWYERSDIFEQLSAMPGLRKIHISGGEPIFIKKHFDFLEMLVLSGNSKNIMIDYNSNITNIPKKIIDIWKNFRTIQMGASIDGIGNVNDYIRHPSKWKKIEDNFKKLSELENCRLWVTTTVMIYNILYLPDIFEWTFSMNNMIDVHDLHTVINLHLLRNPEYLNIQVLPWEAKIAVKHKLDRWLKKMMTSNLNQSVKNQLKSLINGYTEYMFQQDLSEKHLGEFFKITSSLDKMRNESFSSSLPELHSIIGSYSG